MTGPSPARTMRSWISRELLAASGHELVVSGNLTAPGSTPGDAHSIERRVVEDFDSVFRENYRSVYRFLARRVGTDLGEQLASEVFLTAYRRRHDFVAVHASPLPWLYGIASGLLANHRRKEVRHL